MRKQKYVICWVVDKYRRDKRTGAISPVSRSEYVQHLFNEGMGWDEQSRVGKLGR